MSNVPHTSDSATEQLPPSYSASQEAPKQPPQQPLQQPLQQPPQQGMVATPQVFYQMGPGGQPQAFYSQQPMAMVAQPYTAPVQPLVTAPMGATIPAQYPPPNSYVALSAVVLVICGFLNITSILFGIPALALAIQSEEHKRQLQYAVAKSRGDAALGLVIIDIVYTAAFSCIITGLVLGLGYPYRYYPSSY